MKRLPAFVLLLLILFSGSPSFARGGQAADDCPPGNKDPDCVDKK